MNDAMPMSVLVDASLGSRRFYMTLLAVFAGVALLLAIVGTYGVIAYGVQLRRRELGIRLALGATRQRVMAMVLREGFVLVAIGATIGLGAALVLTRLLESLLFEVGSRDPFTLASATAALIAVALLASLLPARKAAALDPLEAIRVE